MQFNGSLLREKFTIRENTADTDGRRLQINAPSTRMVINLESENRPPEILIIRTHNMHSCARLAGKILNEFDRFGPIVSRTIAVKWDEHWDDIINHYERTHIPNKWMAIYHKGKPIHQIGEHHPFLDVIEKCDAVNKSDYDSSIKLAQNAFAHAGKNVTIDYDTNVALVANLDPKKSRCGMILRNPDRTTTFNVVIEAPTDREMGITLGLFISAAFLEGVQLAYLIGVNQEKKRRGIIRQYSAQDKQTREARERLMRLDGEIGSMENIYKARYRPEKPNFQEIIMISERIARKQVFTEESSTDTLPAQS